MDRPWRALLCGALAGRHVSGLIAVKLSFDTHSSEASRALGFHRLLHDFVPITPALFPSLPVMDGHVLSCLSR